MKKRNKYNPPPTEAQFISTLASYGISRALSFIITFVAIVSIFVEWKTTWPVKTIFISAELIIAAILFIISMGLAETANEMYGQKRKKKHP